MWPTAILWGVGTGTMYSQSGVLELYHETDFATFLKLFLDFLNLQITRHEPITRKAGMIFSF